MSTEFILNIHIVFALFAAGGASGLNLGDEMELAAGLLTLLLGAVAAGLIAATVAPAGAGGRAPLTTKNLRVPLRGSRRFNLSLVLH